ncbi:transposase family protein [Nocardiopsis sp. LOL_012]
MLFYPAALPLSRRTLNLAARTIRTHRKNSRSRWRRLAPAQQAPLVLVHLYKGEPFARVAAGFGVGTTTAWRYVPETTALLAQQAPALEQGLRRAHRKGRAYVIVDARLDRLRPRGSRPPVLLGQAQAARHEHPGRRGPGR